MSARSFNSMIRLPSFAGTAFFVFARRLVPGTNEMRIAVAAAAVAAFCGDPALAGFGEVEKLFAGVRVDNDGADGNFEDQVIRVGAVAFGTFAVAAATGFEFAIVAVAEKRVVMRIGFHDDVAAISAIAAGRSPRGTYFSLRNATAPSPPSPALIEIFSLVCKHESHPPDREMGESIRPRWG